MDPNAKDEQGFVKKVRVENLVISIPSFADRNASITLLKYMWYKNDARKDTALKTCMKNIDDAKLVNATNGWGITYLYYDSDNQKLFVDLQRPLNVTELEQQGTTHQLTGTAYKVQMHWGTFPELCNKANKCSTSAAYR